MAPQGKAEGLTQGWAGEKGDYVVIAQQRTVTVSLGQVGNDLPDDFLIDRVQGSEIPNERDFTLM